MTKLNVKTRAENVKINQLRAQKLVPAVVYSKGQEAVKLSIHPVEFEKVYHEAGESSLIDLNFEDGSLKKVLINEVQNDPIKRRVLHVDFYEVDLAKKVSAPVELEFVGEAPVAKNEGGIVVKHLQEIEIECLPMDLIKKFKVDISSLTDFSDAIHVKDLKISDKITILNNLDDVVVNVSEPRTAEEPIVQTEVVAEETVAKDAGKETGNDKDKKAETK